MSDLYGKQTLKMSSVSPTRGLGPPSFPDRHERGGDDGGVVGDAITHEARLRLAFDAIDIDGSNSVGKRELYDALRRVGVRGTESQMLGLFRDAKGERSEMKAAQEAVPQGSRRLDTLF